MTDPTLHLGRVILRDTAGNPTGHSEPQWFVRLGDTYHAVASLNDSPGVPAANVDSQNSPQEQYEELYRRAIECVDRVFQEGGQEQPPILPDFLQLGDDKFEGVIKLAEEYIRFRELLRSVIAGRWCVTDLQEAIGDLEG